MARSSTVTKLPLDRFFFQLGMHPLHANQVYLDTAQLCPDPLKQFAWQNNSATSREDIAREIRQAEDDIERWLGFPLLPTWYTDEEHTLDWWGASPYPYRRWTRPTLQLDHGHLISGGVRRKTLVEAGVAVAYTDVDSDGYEEVATVVTAAPVDVATSACDVHAYFPGHDGEDEYEIRPLAAIAVNPTTGLITLSFRREQAVLLTMTDDPINPEPIDGTDDANFLEEVDVYLVDNDPSAQLTLEWSAADSACGQCAGVGCTACMTATQTACLVSRDKRLGLATYVSAAWNAATEAWDTAAHPSGYGSPARALVNYRAGWQYRSSRCPYLIMDPRWERLVTILAVSRLDRRFCSCDTLEAQAQNWRRSYISGEEGAFTPGPVAQRVIDNPLGTTVGAVHVWNTIRSMITAGGGELVKR